MAKPAAPQCHAMTTFYIDAYRDLYKTNPVVNRNKARYGFEGLLMDYGQKESRDIVEYYLKHFDDKGLDWFFYNYEKVIESMKDEEKEKELSRLRRAATAKRLEEWNRRWQK